MNLHVAGGLIPKYHGIVQIMMIFFIFSMHIVKIISNTDFFSENKNFDFNPIFKGVKYKIGGNAIIFTLKRIGKFDI